MNDRHDRWTGQEKLFAMSETAQMSIAEVAELWGKAERKVDDQRKHIATLEAQKASIWQQYEAAQDHVNESKVVAQLLKLIERTTSITVKRDEVSDGHVISVSSTNPWSYAQRNSLLEALIDCNTSLDATTHT